MGISKHRVRSQPFEEFPWNVIQAEEFFLIFWSLLKRLQGAVLIAECKSGAPFWFEGKPKAATGCPKHIVEAAGPTTSHGKLQGCRPSLARVMQWSHRPVLRHASTAPAGIPDLNFRESHASQSVWALAWDRSG